MAKRAIDLSKFDQENLRIKVKQWKKENENSSFYYRPLGKKTTSTESTGEAEEGKETFLYVHQEKWQRELLTTYGNTITLMDATYKTTKYNLSLFFLCVKTNVNYTVVAEFVIESENTDQIFEALSVIKLWKPGWNHKYFITDYSEAEMSTINMLFPKLSYIFVNFTETGLGEMG